MKRWLAVAIVGVMLAVPLASAVSFIQPGNGPQRTGAIDFEGPQTNDTALEVQLPGVPAAQPALIDGDVYLYTGSNEVFGYDGDTANLTENALWRIDTDTANVERIMDLPIDEGMIPATPPVDPNRLVMQDRESGELLAIDVPSGEERWRVKALPDDTRDYRLYTGTVQTGDALYIGFIAFGAQEEQSGATLYTGRGSADSVAGVMGVDLRTGETLWTWTRNQAETPETPLGQTEGSGDRIVLGFRLSADDERVYAYAFLGERMSRGSGAEGEYAYTAVQRRQFELTALDATDGDFLWNATDTETRRAGAYTSRTSPSYSTMTGYTCCAFPTVTETRVTMRLDAFEAFNPATGERLWTSPAGSSDRYDLQGSFSMGARQDTLVATSPQTVYRLDATGGGVDWRDTTTDQGFGNEPIVLDEETAYVPTSPHGDEDNFHDIGVEARNLETGEVEWRWSHHPDVGIDDPDSNQDSSNPAFGRGIAVWPSKDGTVTVIGETEASLGEPEVPEAKYPDVGNETTIDASGAEPGVFGNATRYMVDWGDGTVSGWQDSPVLTHTYNESGDYEAQVYAGNDANQTSSTFIKMNVGEAPPVEPNWIEERFQKENQDMTFGILGIAVALGGGAIGVARRKRKQTILQQELETLEEGFERTKDNPGECEAFLDTRKARAQSLLLDGDLTEEQFGVIERRIDELHRELRTSVLDTRFEFLPHGMVQSLKKMLADGRISTWEREALADLLDREETLTEAQKDKVRSQLERWFAEDAGSGEP